MDKWDMNELAWHTDALAWAVLLMAAHLEEAGYLDGERYRRDLKRHADSQGNAGKAEAASALRAFESLLAQAARRTGQ